MNKNNKNKVWLVGHTLPIENFKKLPQKMDVLKAFLHHQIMNNETVDNCIQKVASDLIRIWNSKKVETIGLRNICMKIKKLKSDYDSLKKTTIVEAIGKPKMKNMSIAI